MFVVADLVSLTVRKGPILSMQYSETCHSKRTPKIGFQGQLLFNAGQKYCRMLQGEHSAILLTFIKLPFVIKIFVLSIFEWPLKTGFTVVICIYGPYIHNGYAMVCPPVHGDNSCHLAPGLSSVQVDNHGITILYHLHQCGPFTL